MAPRVALITGCSSGIGLVTAVMLAQDPSNGYIVHATMRNLDKKGNLEKATGSALNKTLFISALDVTKPETVKEAVSAVKTKHGRLDILINNAGFGSGGLIEFVSMDQIKQLFETNFFGVVRMTQEVIPIMKQQRSGRIITISSVVGITGQPFLEVYSASKFAVEGFSESLAMTLRHFNIWVSTVQPGPVATDFSANIKANNQNIPQELLKNADPLSLEIMGKVFGNFAARTPAERQSSEEIAKVIKNALEEEKPHLQYPTSEYRREYAAKKFVDPTGDTYINTMIPDIKPDSMK